MKTVFIFFIKLYQKFISPMLGSHCRFYPTCSTYMIQAIEAKGVIRGGFLGVKRLLKCHPYHKGDFIDPVPETKPHFPSKCIATQECFGYKRKQLKASNKEKK